MLISPYALVAVNKEDEYITINLTKSQIENSPSLGSDEPVSRQFHAYYEWPMWGGLENLVQGGPFPIIESNQVDFNESIQTEEEWDLIIDTGNWRSGKKILISSQWVERVSWDESKVFINLPHGTIKESPEYTEEA